MRNFLLSQLDGASGSGVSDLCLDHKLVAELHHEKFQALAGLDLFPDLQILSISMHALRDLKGLPILPKLHELDLSLNEIAEIWEVKHLPKLQILHLQHNEISDLRNMQLPQTLMELNLSFNHFEGEFSLAGLPLLQTLLLNGNRRIRSLGDLPKQLQELQLRQCFIQDFGPIAHLKQLRNLGLSPGTQTDLSGLINLSHLETLSVTGHRLGSHFSLPPLPHMQHLRITQAKELQFLIGLEDLTGLKQLEVSNTLLNEVPDISRLQELEILRIKASPIQSLKGLEGLKGLKRLYLKDTLITGNSLAEFQNARPEVELFLN